MDHIIATLTACTVVDVPPAEIEAIVGPEPCLTKTLWWATLVDEAILREWLVSMGRPSAEGRLAHLICELYLRMQTIDRVEYDGSFAFPFTQPALADMTGLSVVHVNRVLTELRSRGYIDYQVGRITISDFDRLRDVAEFEPNYLHLQRLSGGFDERSAGREAM